MKKVFLIFAVLFLTASLGYCASSTYCSKIKDGSVTLATGTTIYASGSFVQGVYVANQSTGTVVYTFVDGGAAGTVKFVVQASSASDRYISFADTVRQINFNTSTYVYANDVILSTSCILTVFYDKK